MRTFSAEAAGLEGELVTLMPTINPLLLHLLALQHAADQMVTVLCHGQVACVLQSVV
jgi:putative intracellular protease/amidase